MSSDDDGEPPRVPITCPECETTTQVALSEVAAAIERHNEQLHDGAEVAEVDPEITEHIADLVADELGLIDDAGEPR